MNKKILMITTFLALAMLVTPIMAAPATKIPGVTLTFTGVPTPYPGFPQWVSDGTISHSKGYSSGTSTLTIPGVGTYSGSRYAEWIGNGNWKKGEWVINANQVLTFEGGTFVGMHHREITGESPVSPTAYFKDYMVLQGTGIFKGWTLKLSFEGMPPAIQEGILIMPK